MKSRKLSSAPVVTGQCLCGVVQFEMEYPAFWAWHDHGRASRLAHGAVYATYVGTWRKRFRITAGEREINRFEEKDTGAVRSFCRCCGTPLIYERTRSRHMINIPRALFQSRTGTPVCVHNISTRIFRPLGRKLGFPITWHSFRRACATFADQLGVSLGERMAVILHASCPGRDGRLLMRGPLP